MLRLQEQCGELASILADVFGLRVIGDADACDSVGDATSSSLAQEVIFRPWLESAFKSSTAKKDGPRHHMATNLHVQV